jgi:hypothetical protein
MTLKEYRKKLLELELKPITNSKDRKSTSERAEGII